MRASNFFDKFETKVKSMTWPGTSVKIFGEYRVKVVAEIPAQQLSQFDHPFALIIDQGFVSDKEYQRLGWQKFSIAIFVENDQDSLGRSSMLGSGNYPDSSRGKGCKTIEEILIYETLEVTLLDGEQVCIVPISLPKPQIITGNENSVFKFQSFQTWCSLD